MAYQRLIQILASFAPSVSPHILPRVSDAVSTTPWSMMELCGPWFRSGVTMCSVDCAARTDISAIAPITKAEKRKRDQDLMGFEKRARVSMEHSSG